MVNRNVLYNSYWYLCKKKINQMFARSLMRSFWSVMSPHPGWGRQGLPCCRFLPWWRRSPYQFVYKKHTWWGNGANWQEYRQKDFTFYFVMLQLNTKSNICSSGYTYNPRMRKKKHFRIYYKCVQKENVKPIGMLLTLILPSVRPHIDRLVWISTSCPISCIHYITLHRLI